MAFTPFTIKNLKKIEKNKNSFTTIFIRKKGEIAKKFVKGGVYNSVTTPKQNCYMQLCNCFCVINSFPYLRFI